MKKFKNLKTGVIGVGSMGRHHARIYSEISDLVGDKMIQVTQITCDRVRCVIVVGDQLIVDYVKPDLIILQEIDHKNGIDLLLSNVFNVNDSSFAVGPLPSTQWMKNGIIYNRTKFDLTSHNLFLLY